MDDAEPRPNGAVYGTPLPSRAAEHRRRVIGRTRAITLGVAASATGASAVLGIAFAGTIPGHARPTGAQTATPTQTPGAGSSQAPGAGSSRTPTTGSPQAPGGQAPGTGLAGQGAARPSQGLGSPAQPPTSPPPAPPVVSSGGS